MMGKGSQRRKVDPLLSLRERGPLRISKDSKNLRVNHTKKNDLSVRKYNLLENNNLSLQRVC